MDARELALSNEILRVEVGSALHGTGIPGQSDRDEMGICIPPPEYVLGLKNFEHYTYNSAGEGNRSGADDLDLTIYSLKKFVGLAASGNPSLLTTLFAPNDRIIKGEMVGKSLLDLAPAFYSKKAAARYLGYMQSQRKGLTGERKSGVPKRPEIVEMYGYDTKYAMHAVRLGMQGVEFLQTGKITLPMEGVDGNLCRAIRHGKYSLKYILKIIDELELELNILRDNTSIPNEPDHRAINTWLIWSHNWWWNKDLK